MRVLLPLILLTALSVSAQAAVIHVPADQPTIQAGIDAAVDGDSVIVACGTYHEYYITMKSGVTLTSATGLADCVTIDAQQQSRVFNCLDLVTPTRIVGFTIKDGLHTSNGGGMNINTVSSLTIDNCRFIGNEGSNGGGIYCWDTTGLTITNCSFSGNVTGNTGGGIWISQDCVVALSNCTFTENEAVQAGGLGAHSYSVVTLSNCTFRNNSVSFNGGGVWAWYADVTIDNCIIADSVLGEGFFLGNTTVAITCTDIHGNDGGNWIGDIAGLVDIDGNFSMDPQFCGIAGSGNSYLQSDSPCAPGNHPVGAACDLIGALPVGCEATATEAVSWSRMKSLY